MFNPCKLVIMNNKLKNKKIVSLEMIKRAENVDQVSHVLITYTTTKKVKTGWFKHKIVTETHTMKVERQYANMRNWWIESTTLKDVNHIFSLEFGSYLGNFESSNEQIRIL